MGRGWKSPVGEFICDLRKSRIDAFNRLLALFRKIVEQGRIVNETQFKDIKGHKPLYEFKPHGVRIYCFFDGKDRLILVDGDFKKTNKSSVSNIAAIARAEGRVKLYWTEKEAGRLEVIE